MDNVAIAIAIVIAVVVAAHNEEVLLPAALDALAAASRHPDLTDVRITTVVVAESCRDLTAEIAIHAGAGRRADADPPRALSARHRLRYEATRPAQGAAWHHRHVHGANLGVNARAYRAVSGFPPLDVGEDRALVGALDRHGHRVLRPPACPVLTSARLRARARGGFADHLATLSGPPSDREAAG